MTLQPILRWLWLLCSACCWVGCHAPEPSGRANVGGDAEPGPKDYLPMTGDLVFQSLPNPMGMDLVDAIEGATHSEFSHCGMVFEEQGQWRVIEAIGPVQVVGLAEWQQRGRGRKLRAYRLAEPLRKHAPATLAAMRKDLGKPYDPHYRFDDQAIYCSELLYRGWKEGAGVALGRLVRLGELDWKPYQAVIEAIEGVQGEQNLPLDRLMITPRDLAQAPELQPVWPPQPPISG